MGGGGLTLAKAIQVCRSDLLRSAAPQAGCHFTRCFSLIFHKGCRKPSRCQVPQVTRGNHVKPRGKFTWAPSMVTTGSTGNANLDFFWLAVFYGSPPFLVVLEVNLKEKRPSRPLFTIEVEHSRTNRWALGDAPFDSPVSQPRCLFYCWNTKPEARKT